MIKTVCTPLNLIEIFASFDADYDQIQWLQRIATAQTVSMLE